LWLHVIHSVVVLFGLVLNEFSELVECLLLEFGSARDTLSDLFQVLERHRVTIVSAGLKNQCEHNAMQVILAPIREPVTDEFQRQVGAPGPRLL
jgi:membrane-bound lytic murein transglycosylase MltF